MLVFSVLLAGCVDESGGSSEYSSNAQAQNVYVPQHYNNLLSSDSYQFSAQHIIICWMITLIPFLRGNTKMFHFI